MYLDFSLLARFWFFFFKQKTAYEMRISDWSSDVCSSDLRRRPPTGLIHQLGEQRRDEFAPALAGEEILRGGLRCRIMVGDRQLEPGEADLAVAGGRPVEGGVEHRQQRSAEHTSELQSLMRISYAVFCLKKKKSNRVHDNPSMITSTYPNVSKA